MSGRKQTINFSKLFIHLTVKPVQNITSHSSAKITWDTYSHLFDSATKKAVNKLSQNLFRKEKLLAKREL